MIDFQRKILGDKVRNQAFANALAQVIWKGGITVADIGAGTGLLSFLARKLGAKTCFLYEPSGALILAKRIARANGIRGCHYIPAHSSEVRNPVQVDLVLSETLGNFAVEEHIIENLEDGKRFLKAGGTLIPQGLRQYVAPITTERPLRSVDLWNCIGFGIDFAPLREMALQNLYVERVREDDLLPGGERCWDTIDFRPSTQLGIYDRKVSSIRSGTVSWSISRPAVVYAFASFWECELVPGVVLSTKPSAPATHWEQVVLPLFEPLRMKRGDRLTLVVRSDSRWSVGLRVQWQAKLHRRGRVLQQVAMDTRNGD